MIRGPDVVEELDFDHRFQPTSRETDGASHDVCLGEGRVVDAVAAELPLQAPGHLEDAALAFDFLEVLLAADVGDVLAEHEDARVARHLIFHARVEQIHHGGGLTRKVGIVLGVELLGGGIDVRRVHPQQR